MKITDAVLDLLNDTLLFEMAYERKVAINKIRELQTEICVHLVKYFYFEYNRNSDHWLTEIDAWLSKINFIRLKPNGKKLSGDAYYNILFDEPLGHGVVAINDITTYLNRTYKDLSKSGLSDYQILEKTEKALHSISYDIANSKFTTLKDYI